MKKLNNFHAQPVLLIVLNCFFNIAVQSFSIYMTFAASSQVTGTGTVKTTMATNNNSNSGNGSISVSGNGDERWSNGSTAGRGIEWNGIIGSGQELLASSSFTMDAWGASKESPQTTVAHLYIVAVNSVFILINYCELWTTIRASTIHRAAVSMSLYLHFRVCVWD